MFVNFGREAALRGYRVLRFDLAGHGDSQGQSEDMTVTSYLDDIESAKIEFRRIFPNTLYDRTLGTSLRRDPSLPQRSYIT